MRLCNFKVRGEVLSTFRLGLVEGDSVLETRGQTSIVEMLGEEGVAVEPSDVSHRISDLVLGPPVPRPGKIVAAIVNTVGMLGGDDIRLEAPRLDMKAPSTVVGPGAEILAPGSGVRPEVELAAIVGSRLSGASPSQAKSSIFGYTVLNDVTSPKDSREDAYDAYRRDPKSGMISKTRLRGPLFRSKNHDTFCPVGPWVVTADEFAEVGGRRMSAMFEGTLVQDGNTSEYIFSPEELAAYVSGFLTLEPGDLVSCGSVGWTKGALQGLDPSEFVLPLKPGLLELEIEGIGLLSNPVVYK